MTSGQHPTAKKDTKLKSTSQLFRESTNAHYRPSVIPGPSLEIALTLTSEETQRLREADGLAAATAQQIKDQQAVSKSLLDYFKTCIPANQLLHQHSRLDAQRATLSVSSMTAERRSELFGGGDKDALQYVLGIAKTARFVAAREWSLTKMEKKEGKAADPSGAQRLREIFESWQAKLDSSDDRLARIRGKQAAMATATSAFQPRPMVKMITYLLLGFDWFMGTDMSVDASALMEGISPTRPAKAMPAAEATGGSTSSSVPVMPFTGISSRTLQASIDAIVDKATSSSSKDATPSSQLKRKREDSSASTSRPANQQPWLGSLVAALQASTSALAKSATESTNSVDGYVQSLESGLRESVKPTWLLEDAKGENDRLGNNLGIGTAYIRIPTSTNDGPRNDHTTSLQQSPIPSSNRPTPPTTTATDQKSWPALPPMHLTLNCPKFHNLTCDTSTLSNNFSSLVVHACALFATHQVSNRNSQRVRHACMTTRYVYLPMSALTKK